MKQTAVEWLIQNIVEDQTIKAKSMSEWIKIFEQAKAMEKEQIVDAYIKGQSDCEMFTMQSEAEQYYNETYGTSENGC
jgi:hypothetical protein